MSISKQRQYQIKYFAFDVSKYDIYQDIVDITFISYFIDVSLQNLFSFLCYIRTFSLYVSIIYENR